MSISRFAPGGSQFDVTPLENLFIENYMASAPGEFVKAYVYGLMLCYQGDGQDQSARDLAQALHQLLDNAVKFSPEGGLVTLDACEGDGGLYISVSDQGVGIPTDKLAHIFDRFYQADGSTTRRHGGTGLGLAIAKEVVEAHRGRITVESEPDQGSTFTIFLPQR